MSHIIKSNDTLSMLYDDIKYAENHNISIFFVEELLKQMLPTKDDQALIKYNIKCGSYNEGALAFVPSTEEIEISLGKLNYWLDSLISYLRKEFNLTEFKTIKAYVLIHVIAHEIEHAYQYLMGKGIIDSPHNALTSAYKSIFDLVTSDGNVELKAKFLSNRENLLIERNAQIESFDLIMRCAQYNGDENIYDAYESLCSNWNILGYKNNTRGSIEETLKLLNVCSNIDFLLDYKIDMNEEEKIRYGFPISNEARKRLLRKIS